jgi:DNA-binding response OmpR family regulator
MAPPLPRGGYHHYMWRRVERDPVPSIEAVRKSARVLVIDDMELPAQSSFERDGYHFERWSEVKNVSQLTDAHYHLILLDIQGVGLNEDPKLQGLGILREIKHLNPAQLVILYSSQRQRLSSREYLVLADAVLDKSASYLEYKKTVDDLLLRRFQHGYFIATMNRELGDYAILAPSAVRIASRALRTRDTGKLETYLRARLPDATQVDRVLSIISIGVSTASLLAQ